MGHGGCVSEPPSIGELADWLLAKSERGNRRSRVDAQHLGEQAWSTGNLVRPLIHGASYFAELYERIEATREGDLIFFTDWQGDSDERLTGEPGSEVGEAGRLLKRPIRRLLPTPVGRPIQGGPCGGMDADTGAGGIRRDRGANDDSTHHQDSSRHRGGTAARRRVQVQTLRDGNWANLTGAHMSTSAC